MEKKGPWCDLMPNRGRMLSAAYNPRRSAANQCEPGLVTELK